MSRGSEYNVFYFGVNLILFVHWNPVRCTFGPKHIMIDVIEMNALLTKRVWKEMNWLTLIIEPKSRNMFNPLTQ
jgi:hypothetical protein